MASDPLDLEFQRLVREYHDAPADSTKKEAWSLIADFAVENAPSISQALTAALSQGQDGAVGVEDERAAFEEWAASKWRNACPPLAAWLGWQGRSTLVSHEPRAGDAQPDLSITEGAAWKEWATQLEEYLRSKGDYKYPAIPQSLLTSPSPAQEAGVDLVGYELGIRACVDELKKLRDSYPANQHAPTVTVRKALSEAIQQLAHLPATPPAGGGQAGAEPVAWPDPTVVWPDIANPTGVAYLDCLLHRLLDAQQDINFEANARMSQSLCDASALIDEIEVAIRRLATSPNQRGGNG